LPSAGSSDRVILCIDEAHLCGPSTRWETIMGTAEELSLTGVCVAAPTAAAALALLTVGTQVKSAR